MSQILEEIDKTIINLMIQLEEEKNMEEVVRIQLKEKERNCEKLEDKIVSSRKELEKSTTHLNRSLKFEKRTKILDYIIQIQILPLIKIGLGYGKIHMTTKEYSKSIDPPKNVNEAKSKRYVDIHKRSISDEDNKKRENDVPLKIGIPPKDNKDIFIRYFPPRWPHTTRYQNSFLGYCFSCNHFGHKEIDCRVYTRNNNVWNKNISTYGFSNRNYNSFSPLFDYNVVCYKCNKYGHITRFCRSGLVETYRENKEEDTLSKQNKETMGFWRRKKEQEKEKEESILLQTVFHAQNKQNRWYVNSGCSRHMIGDKNTFFTLKEVNEGNVKFGDNYIARIFKKGTLILDDGKTKTENVLYVEGLEHNILSVSQMFDQGHTLTFHSQGCEIRKKGLGILVENAYKTSNNV
jgi:hypothetical protein